MGPTNIFLKKGKRYPSLSSFCDRLRLISIIYYLNKPCKNTEKRKKIIPVTYRGIEIYISQSQLFKIKKEKKKE